MIVTDINKFKDAFVKSTDVAGRPFSNGLYSQKLLNPYYPVAGKEIPKFTDLQIKVQYIRQINVFIACGFASTGIVFSDYDEQLRLQRNISMVALRNLGYGKKSLENKIIAEAGCLVEAFKVRFRCETKVLL